MGESTARASRGVMSKKGPKSEMPSAHGAQATTAVAAAAPTADTIVDPPPVRVAKGKGSAPKSRSSLPPPSKAKRFSKPPEAPASNPPPVATTPSTPPRSRKAGDETLFGQKKIPPVSPLDPTPLAPGVAP